MFRARALTTSLLIVALFTVSCGGDGSVVSDAEGGNSDFPKVIRMIESTTNFTEDDVKSIGWKAQKDFPRFLPIRLTIAVMLLRNLDNDTLYYVCKNSQLISNLICSLSAGFRFSW